MKNKEPDEITKENMQMAIDIVIHSLYKPDAELRLEAKADVCYDELMKVRNTTIEFLNILRRTYDH